MRADFCCGLAADCGPGIARYSPLTCGLCWLKELAAEPHDEPPLEATPADWQEQLETVELDPELDELDR